MLRGRRRSGALLAAATLAGIVDEAQNGPRLLRRLVRRRRTTVNVIARAGERRAGAGERRAGAGERRQAGEQHVPTGTLVVLAHHDAPQTGMLFDQTLQRRLHELAPNLLARAKTSPPQWWIGLAGPLCTIAAALGRRPRPARAGLAIGALGAALVADVWRSPTVPGANDNLSGVAALVGARRAAARATGSGHARAARLLRRRGDAPGRGARVHGAPPRRARRRAHVVRQPRHRRLTAHGHARGRGADMDGGLRRRVAPRPDRGARRARSASSSSAAAAHARRPTASSPAAPAIRSRRSCR